MRASRSVKVSDSGLYSYTKVAVNRVVTLLADAEHAQVNPLQVIPILTRS